MTRGGDNSLSTEGPDDWVKVARRRIAEIVAGKSGFAHATLADLPRALDCIEAADRLADAVCPKWYFALDEESAKKREAEFQDRLADALVAYQQARGRRR